MILCHDEWDFICRVKKVNVKVLHFNHFWICLNVINGKSNINKNLSLYMFVFSGCQGEGQLVQHKSEVTHPISRNLFPHVLHTLLFCLSKRLLAQGRLDQLDGIFPQDTLRCPPKHPLLDHKLQNETTPDRNPQ